MLTDAQKNAVDARNSNVLVSAAAGSGKTFVLVERVMKLITQQSPDVNIDQLLIVTFTKAAAAEMRSRISKRISTELSEKGNDSNLIKQLSLIPNAQICTIDSFCINLVRENFFNLNIAQDFSVLDESDGKLIAHSAIDSVIEELYDSENADFMRMVDALSGSKNDSDLTELVIKIYEYIMAKPCPFEWLNEVIEYYNPDTDFDSSVWKTLLKEEIRFVLRFAYELIGSCLSSLEVDDAMYEKYSLMLDEDKKIFDLLSAELDAGWDDFLLKLDNVSFITMPSKRGYVSPSKALISANRDLYRKNIISEIKSLCSLSSEDYTNDCKMLYPILKQLENVIYLYNRKLREIKDEMNSYSFSDIEHFAMELLFTYENGSFIRTTLAEEYKNRFYEILVDEYQDTNSAQDTLFEMLSNGRNRFMVGDVKQSIYSFRLAMPFIFNDKKNDFDAYGTENSCNQKIIFDRNFRSRLGVCEFANFIFSHIMSERVGEMEYTEEEYLNSENDYEPTEIPSAQLYFIETPENEDKTEYEARRLALLIQNKIDSGEMIKHGNGYERIKYGDIAVLFRVSKNKLPIYSKILKEYNIPVISNNKTNLFDNNEIVILLSLLRVVDNPVQDIPLLATLMSVFYGYSADDIARVRIKDKGRKLYASISENRDIFGRFLDDIERYRSYAASMSVEDFLRRIISETSYLSVISAMGDGEQRRLNVMRLIDIAKKFDSGNDVGLTAFIRYIDNIIDNNDTVESASLANSGKDAVALMSVHQSKGLEFPVCILADSVHQYNNSDNTSSVQLNTNWGIGLMSYDDEAYCRYRSMQYSAIKCLNKYADMSENLRVLYVAVTRAKEQFIALVSSKDVGSYLNKQASKIINGNIYPYVVRNVKCDADLLTMCSLLHVDSKDIKNKYSVSVQPDYSYDFPMLVSELDTEFIKAEGYRYIVPPNEQTVAQLEDKLSFEYNRSELSCFASKRTASSLDEAEQGFEFFAKSRPAFLDSANMTAAQKGTAIHAFMQFCDYNSARDNLEDEISRLVKSSFITQEQSASLSRERLSALFSGDLARRMFESDKLYREIKVSSFIPVCDIEDTDYTDNVLVQGIADCVFEENGELVLVDYKTDKVDTEQELLDRYKKQIGFYRQAIEKMLDKPVKEALLYSFYLNKECIYK